MGLDLFSFGSECVFCVCCRVVPSGGSVLQGVVVAVLGFAELVKEKDDGLKTKY